MDIKQPKVQDFKIVNVVKNTSSAISSDITRNSANKSPAYTLCPTKK